MNTKKDIRDKLNETTSALFNLIVKEVTINEISENISFIIEFIDEYTSINIMDKKYMIGLLKSSKVTFDELLEVIFVNRDSILWVDLIMLYSDKNETIIISTLFKADKSDNTINYHCAVQHPLEYEEGIKFNLNSWLDEKDKC